MAEMMSLGIEERVALAEEVIEFLLAHIIEHVGQERLTWNAKEPLTTWAEHRMNR